MLTAAKIIELRHRLTETEKEINVLFEDYLKEFPYITNQGPTAGLWEIIQIQDTCVKKLAEEERKMRRGGKE